MWDSPKALCPPRKRGEGTVQDISASLSHALYGQLPSQRGSSLDASLGFQKLVCIGGKPGVFPGAQALKDPSLSNLGVPPGRGNCPLTMPLPFDLIYTDYHGLQQMRQHMGLSFKKYR